MDGTGREMEGVLVAIRERKSTRAFSSRTVGPEVVRRALYAARWAPSSGNQQPWRWVIVTNSPTRAGLDTALNPGNLWAKRAPVLAALVSHPHLDHQLDSRDYFLFDSGLSAMCFILQCVHEGLVAHPLVGFNEQKAREALGTPPDYRVIVIVAVGYPGNPDTDADEATRHKDTKQRTRFPGHIVVHNELWGQGYPDSEDVTP
jgi:nitroreductase